MDKKVIKAWTEENIARHTELLKELAAIPAPSGHEDARVKRLMAFMHKIGAEAFEDGAKNVIVPMGDLSQGGAMVFAAHTDVVFPDLTPLPVMEEGDILYAPGVGDDTANLAALVTAIRFIKEKNLTPKRPVLFVFDSCEEGLGDLKGTRTLMREYGGRISEFISFDCSFEEGIITRAVGSERWRVTAKTRGGHSFNDFGSPSAIHELAKFVSALCSQRVPKKEGSRTTFNVGAISGGTSVNTIAESAELLYEYRSDDRECLAIMRESFEKLFGEAGNGGAEFAREPIGVRPCGGNVDPSAQGALIARCEAALKEEGVPSFRSMGSTDSNIPLSMGIPSVTFGLYEGAGAHTRGEWLKMSSLKKGLDIALGLILEEFE